MLEELKESDSELDTMTYNTAISACAKLGRSEKALELLDELNSHPGAQADKHTYCAAIRACETNGEYERALTSIAAAGPAAGASIGASMSNPLGAPPSSCPSR